MVVAVAVVEAAGGSAVGLGGGAAEGPGLDVVDLAVLSRCVAEVVEALLTGDFGGSSGGAGEDAAVDPDVDDA